MPSHYRYLSYVQFCSQSNESCLRLTLDFLSARGAFGVFKELKRAAAFVCALYHQPGSAYFASLISEGLPAACRACYIEWPPAPGANRLSLFYASQACRALISERASAAAFRAQASVTIYEFAAVDTWLLVCRHEMITSCYITLRRLYIITGEKKRVEE